MIFGVNTMFFKKAGGSIFGVSLNKAEQKALDQEIKRQIVEHDNRFDIDKESMILWMLHTEFGFGPKRLKRAWELFYSESQKLRDYYLLDEGDEPWIARQKLKEIGCDVEAWYQEWRETNVQTLAKQ